MKGQRIGYIRVSSFDQNPDRQLEHVQVDKVFTDKASGKDMQRPQLEALLGFVREGDTVVVHSMDRLARNLDDLRRLVQSLTKRGVRIEFAKESLTFTGEDSPMANLMLSVMGAFAEFERALIRERQREGIALAKQRGAYRGRKKALAPERVTELRNRAGAGEPKAALARVRHQPRDPLPIPEDGRRMNNHVPVDGLSDAECLMLVDGLRALRKERAAAWNVACDAADATGSRRPPVRQFGIHDIIRLAERLGGTIAHRLDD